MLERMNHSPAMWWAHHSHVSKWKKRQRCCCASESTVDRNFCYFHISLLSSILLILWHLTCKKKRRKTAKVHSPTRVIELGSNVMGGRAIVVESWREIYGLSVEWEIEWFGMVLTGCCARDSENVHGTAQRLSKNGEGILYAKTIHASEAGTSVDRPQIRKLITIFYVLFIFHSSPLTGYHRNSHDVGKSFSRLTKIISKFSSTCCCCRSFSVVEAAGVAAFFFALCNVMWSMLCWVDGSREKKTLAV